ncbi:uncharacterized protein LOC128558992 isoform X2 [Mercenaria mercenaria]|uniref:uncharacterized protein LOC128558992 isoform X2 n=1 Tax=Mercenaria mercenaria TaxID=6596 RepID=UPI00234F2F17|nr:uncharacterized protein LOC128558992 isoform X2 [Mercenaria mercenaria]
MLNRVLFLLSLNVVSTVAVECYYKGSPLLGGGHELKSMYCEDGCCGTFDKQECCKGLNWWMVFAFVLAGFFIIFVIVAAVYLILKQKNKKKERVGNRESDQGQPSTVDLSVFRTDNHRAPDPPAYSMYQDRRMYHDREANQHFFQEQNFVPDSERENARNETSWRNSDLSYFDKYLKRTKQPTAAGNQMEFSALNRSPHNTENTVPTKLAAEYEELRVSMDPDLTAECTYIGNTAEQTTEHPVLERTDTSQFHFMAPRNPS